MKNPCRNCNTMQAIQTLENEKKEGFYAKQNDLRIKHCKWCARRTEYINKSSDPYVRGRLEPGAEIYNLNIDNRGKWERPKDLGVR